MQARTENKFEINKNIKDLEYKKLLNEYNAWLIALISISVAILGFMYTVTNDITFSFLSALTSLFAINVKREEKSEELKEKIVEIKNLANDKDPKFA